MQRRSKGSDEERLASDPLEAYRQDIEKERLFDPAFYASHSPDVVNAGIDLLEHFFRYGHAEGRWPTADFDPNFYRAEHLGGDLRINPVVHYLLEGKDAGLPTTTPISQVQDGTAIPFSIGQEAESADDFAAFCKATGVFDGDFYLSENRDLACCTTDPLQHFMEYGWKEGRDPSRIFSLEWYRNAHLGGDRGVNPLWHYYTQGIYSGYAPMHGARNPSDIRCLRKLAQTARFVYPDSPEVTIAVINLNGEFHLQDLMASLAELDYPSYRVMVIDNGSTDGSVKWMHENAPFAEIVELDENIGFADAANLALDLAPTQLVAVLNNDMSVDKAWLRELVDAMKSSPERAAVTSKILFFKPFLTLSVQGDRPFGLSVPHVLKNHDYKKFFVDHGRVMGDRITSAEDHTITIKIPCELGKTIEIAPEIDGPDKPRLLIRANGVAMHTAEGATSILLDPAMFEHAGRWVVNNAGSHEKSEDVIADRGFGEYDVGQYDTDEDVRYLCGGSFLINRTALKGLPLFIGDLFAYYEDTELSVRLRRDGYNIGYAPKSVVYHKHASTSEEKSVFFQRRVERNYSAYFARRRGLATTSKQIARKKSQLNHLANYFASSPDSTDRERALSEAYPEVMAQLDDMMEAFTSGREFHGSHRTLRMGIYNSYWATAGGGELHALNVAFYLSRFGVVDLISDADFDLDQLVARFRLPRERFRKILLYPLSPEDTAAYDVFVNSTYASNLASKAKHSFFIVSFPHQGAPEAMLDSYTFLPNSQFTHHWCIEMWGSRESKLLYPMVRRVIDEPTLADKKKVVLNVGRFFPDGHSKMQHEIVATFRELTSRQPDLADWKLICVGGVDRSRKDCLEYFDLVAELAEGANVELWPNASFDDLTDAYRDAALYWHATGFGKDATRNPDELEHFGISTVEAMSAGCIPVVLDAAGQTEIVHDQRFGSRFRNRTEWIDESMRWMNLFERDPEQFAMAMNFASKAAERYQAESTEHRMGVIFSEVAKADAELKRHRGSTEFTTQGFWRSRILYR
ncbi:glycosyltransferase [Maritalea mobilis]|uniref:glycosyltransferase n=1 Tax=Maritalea mobilis TaxID=483324 RepID=UPI001C94AC97|nr:glycosyltransferase [Maritalea mobilis]MBY6203106.1 glycosyltransferase [Maritalea mobilis]